MSKFKKKPVEIEAVRFTGENHFEILFGFIGAKATGEYLAGTLAIHTLEGVMTAQPGDWIIKGVGGEFYPCKPDIFEKTYDRVI